MTYRYEGFYFCDDDAAPGWVALIGGCEYTRSELEKMTGSMEPEQRAEIDRALSAIPGDDVPPKRGQRRKPVPVEGSED